MAWKKTSSYQSRKKGSASPFFDRIRLLQAFIIVFACLLSVRLFDLQVLSYEELKAAADGEHKLFKKLFPKRGQIYVRETHASKETESFLAEVGGERVFPAVTNRDYMLVYAVPKDITNPESVAEVLAPILEIEKEKILERVSKKNDSYEVLKRKVPEDVSDQIKTLSLPGIGFTTESYRFYPEKGLGGHIFGFLGYAGEVYRGVYGLEGYFNDLLSGKEGSLKLETDALGALIPTGENRVIDAQDGMSLILTLDRTVQMVTCDRLHAWVLKHGADGGTVVIMNPKTGSLIAMCSSPDFDPAEYSKHDVATYPNPAIFTPFEPGSTFKAITMAMGLEREKVTPGTTYEDTGSVKIGRFTIKNSDLKSHGRQTMTQVLDESLNTGAIWVARKVGLSDFRTFVKSFGFGEKTGIELDKETRGTISSLNDQNEVYLATASFGQGITATPMQMVNAYAVIANGGNLMQPYIVDAIVQQDGTVIKTKPKVIRRVISERTATLLSGMLVNVVRQGHGKRAGVPYYYVAGKTGTAQVSKKDGRGYESGHSIGSFIGFAPVDDPRFVMMVKVDRPRDVQWAESSAAPLFGDLAAFLLNYYEVPPDEKADDTKKKK